MHPSKEPSKQIVLQRVRNRIVEYFDLVTDPTAREPFGPDAIINFWEDWQETSFAAQYCEPVFVEIERESMVQYDAVLQLVVSSTPNPMPPLSVLDAMPVWQQLIESEKVALRAFEIRGSLPEDSEVT